MSHLLWSIPVLVACAGVFASGVLRSTDWTSAAALCAAAVAIEFYVRARSVAARLRWPLASLASVFVLVASAPALLELGLRTRTFDTLAPLPYALLRLLGCDVALVEGRIHPRATPLLEYSVDWTKLGLLPATWIGLGCAVLVALYSKRDPLRALLCATGILCAYALARFAILTALTIQFSGPVLNIAGLGFTVDAFVHPWAQTLSFLPLTLFLARWVPWDGGEIAARPARLAARPKRFAAAGVAALAAFAGACAVGLENSGPRKAGRVVIDELHSRDWSSALAPLDTETYGRATVYNYTLLVRFLQQYFDVRVNDEVRYSEAALADVDVLVLKTATKPFAAEEIDAIEGFVRRGGGLFVIGDHTDLLGMSTNLNAVTSRFDMRFRADACNQLEDGQANSWSPLPWDVHPITAGLERIEFMTSCTLDAPSDAQRLLVVRNAFSDALDYSNPSFFGDVAPDMDDPLGVHLVAAARQAGAGRVVLFGDSTVYSSFGLTIGGRDEFLLRTVDWLNRECAPSRIANHVALTLAALLFVALLAAGWRQGAEFWLGIALPASLAGAALGLAVCANRNASAHTLSAPARPLPTISIVRTHCDFALPTPLLPVDSVDPESAYDVFYTWTQRVGALPVVEELPRAFEHAAVVLIRPRTELFERFGPTLQEYVRRGGALMLLGEPTVELRRFTVALGLRLDSSGSEGATIVPDDGGERAPIDGAVSGTTLAHVGRGRLVIVSRPESFSRVGLGTQLEEIAAGDPRRELFAELFRATRWLVYEPESSAASRPVGRER